MGFPEWCNRFSYCPNAGGIDFNRKEFSNNAIVFQLKADLAGIMPTGKKARLVWSQGGTWQQSGNKDLYVVDSDDGVVRKLTTTTVNALNPNLTADGSRVVFGDDLSGAVKVINWDGTGLRTVTTGGFVSEYWQDPTNKSDWFINTQGNGGVTRVSLDLPKQEILLTNKEVSWGNGYIGLSPDGTHLAAWFHLPGDQWRPGTVTVPGGVLTAGNTGGCGLGIAPDDNSYDYFQHLACAYELGHQGILIENGKDEVRRVCLTQSILTWIRTTPGSTNGCDNHNEFQTAKWTNNRNFVTFSMFNTKANPFIVRLSDLKWVHILDDAGCAYTNAMDVLFYTPGPMVSASRSIGPGSRMPRHGGVLYPEIYRIDGRRLAAKAVGASVAPVSGVRGVVITRIGDERPAILVDR
jgi:hypothetical protein